MSLSSEIHPFTSTQPLIKQPTYPDPYAIWLKMLLFGAVVTAMAMLISAAWDFAQLSNRINGVPNRKALNTAFAYVTLGIVAWKWMGIWALTAPTPLDPRSLPRFGRFLWRVRTLALRLLVTALFIFISLRLWGLFGEGLRPALNGVTFTLATQSAETMITILLWLHLLAIARSMGIGWLSARTIVVMLGRAGSLIYFFVLPLALTLVGQAPEHSYEFGSIRFCALVLWDVIAALVLAEFAAMFWRAITEPA